MTDPNCKKHKNRNNKVCSFNFVLLQPLYPSIYLSMNPGNTLVPPVLVGCAMVVLYKWYTHFCTDKGTLVLYISSYVQMFSLPSMKIAVPR